MRRKILSALCVAMCLSMAACGDDDGNGGDDGSGVPDASMNTGETPSITGVDPDFGPLAGGTTVTISGADFTGTSMVVIGEIAVTGVTVIDAATLEVTTPPGDAAGAVRVTVFTQNGFATRDDGYSYNALPTVTDVQPRGGVAGTTITITGSGFAEFSAGTNTVSIGDEACASVTVVDDATITCEAPATTPIYAAKDVSVENTNGAAVIEDGYRTIGPGLFVSEGPNGVADRLFFIDPAAMTIVEVGEVGFSLNGIATDPATGTVYGATSKPGPRQLITIDPMTGAGTAVGPLQTEGVEQPVNDLSWDGTTLYGWLKEPDDLGSIDTATGAVTVIADSGVGRFRSLESNGDGTGLLIDSASSQTQVVDFSTGAVTPGFTTSSSFGGPAILGTVFFDGTLYGVRRGFAGVAGDGKGAAPLLGGKGGGIGALLSIDTETGVVTELMLLPFDAHALGVSPFQEEK